MATKKRSPEKKPSGAGVRITWDVELDVPRDAFQNAHALVEAFTKASSGWATEFIKKHKVGFVQGRVTGRRLGKW